MSNGLKLKSIHIFVLVRREKDKNLQQVFIDVSPERRFTQFVLVTLARGNSTFFQLKPLGGCFSLTHCHNPQTMKWFYKWLIGNI